MELRWCLNMYKKILIIILAVIILAVSIFVAIYFSINVDMEKKLNNFFNGASEIEYYHYETNEKFHIDKAKLAELLSRQLNTVTFKNTAYINNKKGTGILLKNGNESIVIDGNYININNKWYKAKENIYIELKNGIVDILN